MSFLETRLWPTPVDRQLVQGSRNPLATVGNALAVSVRARYTSLMNHGRVVALDSCGLFKTTPKKLTGGMENGLSFY
jgi:hypothetical protein